MILFFARDLKAQAPWHPQWDIDRRFHLGVSVGTNFSTFKWDPDTTYFHQNNYTLIGMKQSPGFTLALLADMHIGRNFNLRFVGPMLVLSQKTVTLKVVNTSSVIEKPVESALLQFPLYFAMHGERHNNTRLYTIGGGNYSIDLSSDFDIVPSPSKPVIAVYPSNFAYEFGLGIDRFYEYFKFSYEVRVSKGINNVHVPFNDNINNMFSRFRSNFLFLSLYFEG